MKIIPNSNKLLDNFMKNKKLLVLSSPSGGGKSVVSNYILQNYSKFVFSISATTRNPRPGETDGKEYYFLTKDEFENKLLANEFIEHEQIFSNYYGTLKSEIDRIIANNNFVIFDIDVKGAFAVKKVFPESSLLLFISPPSLDILEQRLRNRKTETDEQIKNRLSRAEMEISQSKEFDFVVVNEILDNTFSEVKKIIEDNFNEL